MFKFPKPKFRLADGVHVANLNGIEEGYDIHSTDFGNTIVVNISIDRMSDIFLGLARFVPEPLYAIIEFPTNKNDEEQLRKNDSDPLHNDVYYLGGLSYNDYVSLFNTYEAFLVHDGGICFGLNSHKDMNEIFVGRYKILSIHTGNPDQFLKFLQSHKYQREQPLRTVYDNFTPQTPGSTRAITIDGVSSHDLRDIFVGYGFHFGEHRPS